MLNVSKSRVVAVHNFLFCRLVRRDSCGWIAFSAADVRVREIEPGRQITSPRKSLSLDVSFIPAIIYLSSSLIIPATSTIGAPSALHTQLARSDLTTTPTGDTVVSLGLDIPANITSSTWEQHPDSYYFPSKFEH